MIDLLRTRRSIRKFKNIEIEKEKLELIIESALRSPSSRGLNPLEFIIINNLNLIKKLSFAKEHGSNFLANSRLAVVICADPDISDVWVEDASIASIIISLICESLGLGSCWIQIRNRMQSKSISSQDYILSLLDIPKNKKIESIIAIGYPDEKLEPHSFQELEFNKIFFNKYGVKE